MSCVNCARTIEIALKRREGVKEVEVSFELGKVSVVYDEEKISEEEIKRTIEDLGYRVVEEEDSGKEIWIVALSLISALLITFLMFYQIPYGTYVQFLLSTLVQVVGGLKFYKGAVTSLRNGVAGMDVLVSLGTTGAYLYSVLAMLGLLEGSPFFETNAYLIAFVRGGRLIETRAKNRATALLRKLLTLQHSEVTLLEDGKEAKRNVREVSRGQIMVCRNGDMILLDGVVEEGQAYVSEAVLTGEPEPKLKRKGDRVVSGSVVQEGLIKIRVEKIFEDSYLSKLSRWVERALSDKPRVQRLADRVSHYFVYGVVAIALGVFFLWLQVSGDPQKAVQFSLAVLVISCPCALGIATPLAVAVGLSIALERGILIKSPSSLEKVGSIDTVVFDKTGTLTEGKFKVVKAEVFEEDALDVALTLESFSNHPIAVAIREYARSQGAKELALSGCKEIVGKGVECGRYFIGEDGSSEGDLKSVVLKEEDKVIARFYLSDVLRKEAREVVENLRRLGLKTVLLSGDRKGNAEKVGRALGFNEVVAEVTPPEKKEFVKRLQSEGHRVAMVGDGLNDAPALAQADLSVALSQGVDFTKQVGDVVLLSGLGALVDFFLIAKRTLSKIKQNLFWAFIYNAVGIPVAGGLLYSKGIYLKPEIAGLMMALSSVSVVLNTLLLKALPQPKKTTYKHNQQGKSGGDWNG